MTNEQKEQTFKQDSESRRLLKEILENPTFKEVKAIILEKYQPPASAIISDPNQASGMYHRLAGINLVFDELQEFIEAPVNPTEEEEPYSYINQSQ